MTNFQTLPDDFIVAKVRENFFFLTGQVIPEPKGKSKNADTVTENDWFQELSWVHMMIFLRTFEVAKERGLLNKVELEFCQVAIDTIMES